MPKKLSFYDAAIPSYRNGLMGLLGMLDKTAAHRSGVDEAVLLGKNLAERLYPLGQQIIAACGHAEKDPALVVGIEPPTWTEPGSTLVGLRRRVAAALDFLQGIEPDQFDGGADQGIPHGGHSMKATDYILHHSLPHFYFHLTAIYVTLRQNTVPIAKPDFLGIATPGEVAG